MTWPQYLRREFEIDGDIWRIEPRCCEMLLCLMLRRGQYVTHEELVDALWPDDPEGGPLTAKTMFRIHMTTLRQFIGEYLEVRRSHTDKFAAIRLRRNEEVAENWSPRWYRAEPVRVANRWLPRPEEAAR